MVLSPDSFVEKDSQHACCSSQIRTAFSKRSFF